ncbi:MAG: hypothetical protein RL885_13430 [Planctomycetota bacterium]
MSASRRHKGRASLVAALVWLAATSAHAQSKGFEELQVLEPDFAVSEWRLIDLQGDGSSELIILGRNGEVRVWQRRDEGTLFGDEPVGSLVLPDPEHSAVAAWRSPSGAIRLAVASSLGLTWYGLGESGGFEESATVGRQRRAAFTLRIGAPRWLDILQDIDADGEPDLVLPSGRECALWFAEPPASGEEESPVPRFRRGTEVVMRVDRESGSDHERLSDYLQSGFVIPRLDLRDLNGDERPDLLVVDGELRQFHIQGEAGGLPSEPSVTLDLSIFRDTTPAATIQPGRTLAGGDEARLEIADLDVDGVEDYVIAHRRKVWVFHGGAEGPQFQKPTSILKVSDDVTALLLPRLDADEWPDLFLLKVQVPTLATLILGLLTEWDIDITALGYASESGKTFSKSPTWRGELSVTLPSIVSILKDPEGLLRRFEAVGERFQESRQGDFDGDGAPDRLMLPQDGGRAELWRGAGGPSDPTAAFESLLRDVFFERERRDWSLDEVLGLLSRLADERTARLTGGREADTSITLRDPEAFLLTASGIGDIDGDGLDELVLSYRERDGDVLVLEVLRWSRE